MTRSSIRAFLPDPIDRETMLKLLNAAIRTPSWANSQPWEVYIAQGKTLDAIKEEYKSNYEKGVSANPEIARPTQWTEAAKKRQQGLYPDMLRDCGDAAGQFGELNKSMFRAPAVIYLCMDKMLSQWSLFDLGAFSQSVMLAAVEYGLSTIPAITLVSFPEVLHRILGIPDNLSVVLGIAIGYMDSGNKINNFRSARSPVGEVVRFFD